MVRVLQSQQVAVLEPVLSGPGARRTVRPQRLRREVRLAMIGIMVSLPLHMALVWGLSRFEQQRPSPLPQLQEAEMALEIGPPDQGRESGSSSAADAEFEPSRSAVVAVVDAAPPESFSLERSSPAAVSHTPSAPGQGVLGAGVGRGTGSGAGDGDGAGNGFGTGAVAKANLFGVSGTGRRIAYLIDKSASMRGVPPRDPTRLDEAKDELLRSLRELPDFAEVCVVFFDTSPHTLPDSTCFVRMTPRHRAMLEQWIGAVGAGGGTEPSGAFNLVMECGRRPDLVYILSDGDIAEQSYSAIAAMNEAGRPAVINTIAYGSPVNAARLQRLAAQSGGISSAVAEGARR